MEVAGPKENRGKAHYVAPGDVITTDIGFMR